MAGHLKNKRLFAFRQRIPARRLAPVAAIILAVNVCARNPIKRWDSGLALVIHGSRRERPIAPAPRQIIPIAGCGVWRYSLRAAAAAGGRQAESQDKAVSISSCAVLKTVGQIYENHRPRPLDRQSAQRSDRLDGRTGVSATFTTVGRGLRDMAQRPGRMTSTDRQIAVRQHIPNNRRPARPCAVIALPQNRRQQFGRPVFAFSSKRGSALRPPRPFGQNLA